MTLPNMRTIAHSRFKLGIIPHTIERRSKLQSLPVSTRKERRSGAKTTLTTNFVVVRVSATNGDVVTTMAYGVPDE
jgi:hypothetical protein